MPRRFAVCSMILATGLAALAAGSPARAADTAPSIVIPSRPGIPVVINGRDASYAVVEGDWGLARPGHMPLTVMAARRSVRTRSMSRATGTFRATAARRRAAATRPSRPTLEPNRGIVLAQLVVVVGHVGARQHRRSDNLLSTRRRRALRLPTAQSSLKLSRAATAGIPKPTSKRKFE
ncbi:MAG TPA: hypothetical protein VIU42_05870 [Xanthobacteraceae bacterium]